jgi:multiple antibiotic resistance protein
MKWSLFLNFVVSMIAITNPAGSLAVFLGMTSDKSVAEQKQIAAVATLTIIIVLVVITWVGIPVLKMFGISLPAFEITGGLILLIRGLTMLNAKETPTSQTAAEIQKGSVRESIGVVPLAIPIIAGPGAMTTVIIYAQHFQSFFYKIFISVGVVLVALIVGVTLYFAASFSKMLGPTGIKIVTRIMGLILAAIAMSMMTTGIKEVFPGLI